MELCEEYEGRDDSLIEMSVIFGNIEKKFGPADSTKVRLRLSSSFQNKPMYNKECLRKAVQ